MSELFESLQDELDKQEQPKAFSSIDLLNLPPALATFIGKVLRQNGMSLADIATEWRQTPENAKKLLDAMTAKGYLRQVKKEQHILYKTNFRRRPGKSQNSSNAWSALDTLLGENKESI